VPSSAILIANHDEAAVLSGIDDPVAAAGALAARMTAAVVKCGGAGAIVARGDSVEVVRTEPVPAVDTTGAGDAFAAGLLAALADGADLVAAAAQGNVVGAQAVSRLGARP
jgi:ribokinase